MTREHSYGIIPLKKEGKQWQVLMVQLKAGHWGFPKGHPNENESPLEAATRELREETGLVVKEFLLEAAHEENYTFTLMGRLINKTVSYFIGEVVGELKLCPVEIKDARWVPITEAEDLATFPGTKALCRELLLLFPH